MSLSRDDIDIIADVCATRVGDRLEPRLMKLDGLPARVEALEQAEHERKDEDKARRNDRMQLKIAVVAAVAGPFLTWLGGKLL